jgi:hypothetical protein
MAFDVTTLYNLALSEIGHQHTVSDVSEQSLEAETCNRWFGYVSETTFGLAPWPEVTTFARLPLVRERNFSAPWQPGDPSPEFQYLFGTPSDMIRPFHLQSYSRFHFSNKQISCNELAPILYYIRRQPDMTQWGMDLFSAVMYALSAKICHSMTGKADLAITLYQKAELLASDAAVRALSTEDQRYTSDPDWLVARGYQLSSPATRYFYPFAALNIEASQ